MLTWQYLDYLAWAISDVQYPRPMIPAISTRTRRPVPGQVILANIYLPGIPWPSSPGYTLHL